MPVTGPRWQGQLTADLATGSPIYYRPLPGTRRFYNPTTGQEVSEHYVVRIYRPALGQAERQSIVVRGRQTAISTRRLRQDLVGRYATVTGESNPIADPNFQTAVMVLEREKRSLLGASEAEKEWICRPDGDYAQALVQLGRRAPDADWLVGTSPEGYIKTYLGG